MILFACALLCLALFAGIRYGRRHDPALARARALAATQARQLAACEQRLGAKDAIITDLFDHCEALNREIDQLRARREQQERVA